MGQIRKLPIIGLWMKAQKIQTHSIEVFVSLKSALQGVKRGSTRTSGVNSGFFDVCQSHLL